MLRWNQVAVECVISVISHNIDQAFPTNAGKTSKMSSVTLCLCFPQQLCDSDYAITSTLNLGSALRSMGAAHLLWSWQIIIPPGCNMLSMSRIDTPVGNLRIVWINAAKNHSVVQSAQHLMHPFAEQA